MYQIKIYRWYSQKKDLLPGVLYSQNAYNEAEDTQGDGNQFALWNGTLKA